MKSQNFKISNGNVEKFAKISLSKTGSTGT